MATVIYGSNAGTGVKLEVNPSGHLLVLDDNSAASSASLTSIQGKLPSALGQAASAASLAVVVASDQSAISVTSSLGTADTIYSNVDVDEAGYVVSTSAARVMSLTMSNSSVSTGVYFRLYDSDTVTVGTTASKAVFYIPPNATREVAFNEAGFALSTGLCCAATGLATAADTTAIAAANQVLCTITYRTA